MGASTRPGKERTSGRQAPDYHSPARSQGQGGRTGEDASQAAAVRCTCDRVREAFGGAATEGNGEAESRRRRNVGCKTARGQEEYIAFPYPPGVATGSRRLVIPRIPITADISVAKSRCRVRDGTSAHASITAPYIIIIFAAAPSGIFVLTRNPFTAIFSKRRCGLKCQRKTRRCGCASGRDCPI